MVTVDHQLEWMWKEGVMVYFEANHYLKQRKGIRQLCQ
jgi:hypothetical protein